VARQTVKPILDAANVKHGKRVLDICCGPGMLAADMTFCGASANDPKRTSHIELAPVIRRGTFLCYWGNGMNETRKIAAKRQGQCAFVRVASRFSHRRTL
jgi:hypothetical protein